jgi:hypothetical protein
VVGRTHNAAAAVMKLRSGFVVRPCRGILAAHF